MTDPSGKKKWSAIQTGGFTTEKERITFRGKGQNDAPWYGRTWETWF